MERSETTTLSFTRPPGDVVRTTLAVAAVGALSIGCFVVLQPFLPALVWATMIVIATWPLMILLERRLLGRRSLATAIMTIILLLVLFVPLGTAIKTIAENSGMLSGWAQNLATAQIPDVPSWVHRFPLVGRQVADQWESVRGIRKAELIHRVTPYVSTVLAWFVSQAGSLGLLVVHFLLTVVLSALLYMRGEEGAAALLRFFERLAGEPGRAAAILAARAVRAVALGIVVTALVQSIMAGLGMFAAGVPYSGLLTALVFMLGVTQIGPVPVLLPTIVWLYWSGETAWGTAMLVWLALVCLLDNFLRPVLIRRGAKLPLLLVFAGVIGGLFAFGIIGLFLGPVILAVTYTLVNAWIDQGLQPAAAERA